MLTRRNRRIAVAVAAIMLAALAMPGVAAADPAARTGSATPAAETACPVNALAPCVASAAVPTRGPGFALGNQALAPVAAAPLLAAAAPVVKAPFLYFQTLGCTYASISVACSTALLGYYDPLDNCYWNKMVPQPPFGDPLWQGHTSGVLYTVTCETHNGTNIGNAAATVQWSSTPPLNYNQSMNTVQQTVAAALNLLVIAFSLAPIPVTGSEPPEATGTPPHPSGVVGLPVWMWADVPHVLWDSTAYSKSSVAFSFMGSQVDWDMGDGHHIVCSTPATAYTKPALPNFAYNVRSGPPGPSPDCGYMYPMAGTYGTTATITWYAAFSFLGTTGTFVLTRTTRIQMLSIGELQAVTK